ncbi:hypothetical protein ACV36C_36680, partial [Pseudomonas aeruginosa]
RITRVEALQWINGPQAERTIETMKKWAMRFLPDVIRNLVDQARQLNLDPGTQKSIEIKLNLAFTRNT